MNKSGTETFRLIFHIGAGKTGTSSIQRSLREKRPVLHSHGYDYWGLMLEHAPSTLYDWQKPSVRKEFISLTPDTAAEQVLDVLERSISESRSKGIKTAIWSHEWFFDKFSYVSAALKELERAGVKVDIVSYVRRHDQWAKSAYIQWGINHKTYKGPIKSFREFVKDHPIRFARPLERWKRAFPNTFIIRNFDATDDVVQDFLSVVNLQASIPTVRVNETPGSEELFLRALFNNAIRGEVLPVEFDRDWKVKEIDPSFCPIEWMSSLLPTNEDLEEVWEAEQNDRQTLNQLLNDSGQPQLVKTSAAPQKWNLDSEKLLPMMCHIINLQQRKIKNLERKIRHEEGEKGGG